MGTTENDILVEALRAAARTLVDRRSLTEFQDTLTDIVSAAVETIPGVDAGGISIYDGRRMTSRSPTALSIGVLDQLQSRLDEGPCIDAAKNRPEDGSVVATDLAGVDALRWPNFAPRAVAQGYRAMLSTQLSADAGLNAALNLYARNPGGFDTDARLTAELFAVQAAMLIYGSKQASGLALAIENRDVIGRAKGILMERFTVDDEEAFQMLVRASQSANVKLVDVAEWLNGDAADRRSGRDPHPEAPVGR